MNNENKLRQTSLDSISEHLKSRRYADACRLCEKTVKQYPNDIQLRLAWCHALKNLTRFDEMRLVIEPVLDTNNVAVKFCAIETYIFLSDQGAAIKLLSEVEKTLHNDHQGLQQVGEFYTHCLMYVDACRCYRRSLTLSVNNPQYQYNLSASLISLGELNEAELLLDLVIDTNPEDYDAYQNRSTLRKQTPDANHVDALENKLKTLPSNTGRMQLCYALSKELEDLGDYKKSFSFLKQGADDRRSRMKYKVSGDVDTMAEIQSLFSKDFMAAKSTDLLLESNQASPIFISGLPRSGTTLVDRIISSHSNVTSLGEINDFALSLVRAVGGQQDKLSLVHASTQLDFLKLGQDYLTSITGYNSDTPFFIDKTPANFLYFGLIKLALPHARIIHLRRHPLDSCYAIYKTLFRMGYPFSYNLDDLAGYYIAYDKLMNHWRDVLGDSMCEIRYEDLVQNTITQSQQLINYCGLDWQPACADFHLNSAPTATASAAQVRQPIYQTSVARWRNYEEELSGLIMRLKEAGIGIE